ncbi:glutamine ABC transporter substrate-binding protein [Helicobacter bilis]|uniref:Glutamine ABC transporter substrate-binding protein n=1 Tax=Helicobacter bilis TaxID=37372 RepID=A0A1Q2LI49_9HELI|nr:glutamine ABC transporter substrate-binding protein [Helicobacter bilis]
MAFNFKGIFRSSAALVLGGAIMLGLLACGDSKQEETKKQESAIETIKNNGKIRIGVFSDKPPFGYYENNEYKGFDVYIAKRFAKDLLGDENKIEFVPVEAAARASALKANKVDIIMANFTKTPEREKQVDFAKPYMKVTLGVVSKDGAITSEEQLQGKTLIVNKGTTADIYFSKQSGINLLKFEQNTETFQAFQQGKGDALSHDSTMLYAWVKHNPEYKVGIQSIGEQDVIAPAVKQGNKELLDWLNAEIDTLQKEGFFKEAYNATLASEFGSEITADMVIFAE